MERDRRGHGHFVAITSGAERPFLNALNPRNRDIWLAALDRETEGVWKWIEIPKPEPFSTRL